MNTRCELCQRDVRRITRHHLIPRREHSKKRIRRKFDTTEMRERQALLCRPCHAQIHTILSHRDMAEHYNTVARLLEHEEIKRFVDWIADKPDGVSVSFQPWQKRHFR